MSAERLKDRPVLVTGAGGGIGSAIAAACAEAGARLFLVDRDPAVEEVAAELGASAQVVDLAGPGAPARAVEAAASELGSLQGVVQAAGIQIARAPLAELEEADFSRLLAVNLTATVMVCKAAAGLMERGAIVNVGSISGRRGMAGIVAYSATKAAVHQLTRGLALELAPSIRVNCVAPGYVDTPLAAGALSDEETRRRIEARVPLGHVAAPEEIAPAVVFLLGEEAAYVTGEVVTVDGGFLSQ